MKLIPIMQRLQQLFGLANIQPSLKTQASVSPERVVVERRSRFNPLRALTPEMLSRQLDAYAVGYLREFAITAEKIEERDDVLKTVAAKRKKAVARRPWEILAVNHSPEAQRHKQALEHFYNHLTCTNATDENQQGSFQLLVRQMMDAVGKGYAVHEIVWKPGLKGGEAGGAGGVGKFMASDVPGVMSGGSGISSPAPHAPPAAPPLTAEFRFVPLWFFENTTGRLRYLRSNTDFQGQPLEPGGWMITITDPLMPASAVAWMYKNLSLKDWVTYGERHGMPGIRGVTNAARGSAEWNEMVEAVEHFACEFAAVMSDQERIEAIDLKGSGELPYPGLIERLDRALAALWRGSDLSTISRSEGLGASLQHSESVLLEQDDGQMLSETFNLYVDRYVIRYLFGEDAEPLAYLRILVPDPPNVAQDLKIDEFLVRHGARLSVTNALERYQRPAANPEEEVLSAARPNLSSKSPPP